MEPVVNLHLKTTIRSHPIIEALLKKSKKLHQLRPVRVPRWDLSIVLDYLNSDRFEPLEDKSEHRLLQKATFLTLLASGRRPSDLAGLALHARDDLSVNHNRTILQYHPLFRPKNRSTQFFPEPVAFPPLREEDGHSSLSCSVRCLRAYRIATGH